MMSNLLFVPASRHIWVPFSWNNFLSLSRTHDGVLADFVVQSTMVVAAPLASPVAPRQKLVLPVG